MVRLAAALILGLLAGAGLTYLATRSAEPEAPDAVVRDIVTQTTMTVEIAEQHREERYVQLATVEEVYALPTEFARREALYALAGRSDAGAVQGLIFEANRIADDMERISALQILFFRLAELDAQSALALARTEYFRGIKSIEETVWRSWGRRDLDDALFAAQTQTSTRHRNLAAQSLYRAFGFMGNETTDRIQEALDIPPDRNTRGRFLYTMADRSTSEAIEYINSLPPGPSQNELVSWLAYYVSLGDPQAALPYADLFATDRQRTQFRNILRNNMARNDPKATLERLLAGDQRNIAHRGEFQSALSTLASTDLDAAIEFYERLGNVEQRQGASSIIASAIASKDPERALAWARENSGPTTDFRSPAMAVLQTIARTDPQRAIAEAQSMVTGDMRRQVLGMLVQTIAQNDPQEAFAYLDIIENPAERREAEGDIAQRWMREDPDAAVDWILTQDEDRASALLEQSSWSLLRSDLDAAIRILPRLNEGTQLSFRAQIAQRMATSRSPAEAQAFVRQFEGEPGYAELQASLIAGVAESDVMLARQLADQLTDMRVRDDAYASIIMRRGQTSPQEAAAWLSQIQDEGVRGRAMGQLASVWFENDPATAERWVVNLPAGSMRDDAIVQLASRWSNPSDEQMLLVADITDEHKRGQAQVRMIYNIARRDPVRARQMLENADLPDYQRDQAEQWMARLRDHRF
ncbi:MAG: hypothetical protein QNJ00_08245 [Woeseiaceae bacterium]|nr:hypothetical protein [Woeseiaceae bacterium]